MLETIPATREARWNLLASLTSLWGEPLSDADGYSEDVLFDAERRLGVALPGAFREWYRLAGRRRDLWSVQDELLPPDQLVIADGFLKFYCENQAVVSWGIRQGDLHGDDVPVLVSSVDGPDEWRIENETVSEFALQMFVYNLKWGSLNRCWGNGVGTPQMQKAIASRYPRFPFPDWHWPAWPTRFFGADDIVIEQNGGGTDYFYVCTRTEEAFREFQSVVEATGVQWDATYNE